jgi:ribosomal protein S27E
MNCDVFTFEVTCDGCGFVWLLNRLDPRTPTDVACDECGGRLIPESGYTRYTPTAPQPDETPA